MDGVAVSFERAPADRFDLVIGADGLHSVVRRLVFGPAERFRRFLGGYLVLNDTQVSGAGAFALR